MLYTNLKTGNIYEVIQLNVINKTNNNNNGQVVLYKRNGKVFVRDYEEFMKKFEPVNKIVTTLDLR